MCGLDIRSLLNLLLDYMYKYPELLEFPNGVQNIMTLFYTEIQYDLSLLTKVMEAIADCFNIVMAKDQFIQKMHNEEEEPYVEYLQPVYLILISALKYGLQPGLP